MQTRIRTSIPALSPLLLLFLDVPQVRRLSIREFPYRNKVEHPLKLRRFGRCSFLWWLGEAPESATTAFAQLLLVQATPLIVDRSIEIVANRPRSLAIDHRARPVRLARLRPAGESSVPAMLCRSRHGQRPPPLIPHKP